MAVYEMSVAAAIAILGYDMAQNENWRVSSYDRMITGIAVCGSAAAGDAAIDVLVEGEKIVKKYNTTTGYPTMDHVQPLDGIVPAGSQISIPVSDAAATNPLNVLIIIEEVEE